MRFRNPSEQLFNDVHVSLAGFYFFYDNLTKIATVEDLTEKLKVVKGQPNNNSKVKYTINLDPTFDDFILKEIGLIQNINVK